jgi:hypothetical protein
MRWGIFKAEQGLDEAGGEAVTTMLCLSEGLYIYNNRPTVL